MSKEEKKVLIENQITELESKARAAMKCNDLAEENRIDAEIASLRKQLKAVLPRANHELTEEDWKKIETEGPTAGRICWGGYWSVRKSDTGPQRYRFSSSWAMSLQDAVKECMHGGPNDEWCYLIYRYEDLRGTNPGPYTLWEEHAKYKHFYICGVVDGTDSKFFRFPRLMDLYHAKDFALELLRKEGRMPDGSREKEDNNP